MPRRPANGGNPVQPPHSVYVGFEVPRAAFADHLDRHRAGQGVGGQVDVDEGIVASLIQQGTARESDDSPFDPVALLIAFGTMQRADVVDDGEAWTTYDRQCDAGPESQIAAVLLALAPVWYRRLAPQGSHVVTAQAVDARRMGRLLGLDLAAIEAEAVREIPEPKSWARLQANSLAEKHQAVNDVARQAIDGDGEEGEGTEVSEEAEAA